jgi:hypothetical protein
MNLFMRVSVDEVIDPEPGQEGQLWITLMTAAGETVKQLGPVTWQELRCIVSVCAREFEEIA